MRRCAYLVSGHDGTRSRCPRMTRFEVLDDGVWAPRCDLHRRSGRANPSRRQRGGLGGAQEVPQPRDLILREKHHLLRRRCGNPGCWLAYRAEEQPREHPPMVGTNLPNAPIAIALHDRALQAEGAAAATLAHHSHTMTVARPSAIRLAVLRRPRAVDDLRNAPADVSHRTGFPPNPPSGIVGTLFVCSVRTEQGLRAHLRTRFAPCGGCARSFWL